MNKQSLSGFYNPPPPLVHTQNPDTSAACVDGRCAGGGAGRHGGRPLPSLNKQASTGDLWKWQMAIQAALPDCGGFLKRRPFKCLGGGGGAPDCCGCLFGGSGVESAEQTGRCCLNSPLPPALAASPRSCLFVSA